jgi:hypothetical protein
MWTRRITLAISSQLFYLFTLPMKTEESVPKLRYIKFRRRGITQKNTTFRKRRRFEIKNNNKNISVIRHKNSQVSKLLQYQEISKIFARDVSRCAVTRKVCFRSQTSDCYICIGPRKMEQGFVRVLQCTPVHVFTHFTKFYNHFNLLINWQHREIKNVPLLVFIAGDVLTRSQNFEKLLLYPSYLSIRPSAFPYGTTLLQLDKFSLNVLLNIFSRIFRKKFTFLSNLTRISVTIHDSLCIFTIISCWILPRIKNISDKSCRENQTTHFIFNNFLSENRAVWRQCEKIYSKDRQIVDDSKTRRRKVRFACRIAKTKIQSQHHNIYDNFVSSSTKYFVARQQCKWKSLCLFHGNNEYWTKCQLQLRQQH